ncbi:MAG TPA: hypothetical protein VGQ81_17180 [Acidobacteriota bacterium]|nr:hypothetical protein [Acidobacteriota bacterium]
MKCRTMLLTLLLLGLICPALAQLKSDSLAGPSPLVRLLQSKGIITAEEARAIDETGSPIESQQLLAKLLLSKGLISRQEYEQAVGQSASAAAQPALRPVTSASLTPGSSMDLAPHERHVSATGLISGNGPQPPVQAKPAPAKPEAAQPIPAVAPLRLVSATIPKKDGLVPDIKLGAGAKLRPYGFFKVSAPHQTASHGGAIFGSNDFVQGPLLLGDTGPNGDPQFHIKDRAMRLGFDFEWPDASKTLTLTGKLEFDFEGDFTNVNNRNISAVRSSMPSLRLAWVRLDTTLGGTPFFAQFGQDWSVFGSSTLMDLFESTGFGFAQGNLYERMQMIRTGFQFGKHDFKFQPEFALAFPSFGEPGLTSEQRSRFGSRVGPEGNQPEIQSRLVFQYPFSRAAGVLPAQIIFSYDHARRAETVLAEALPAGPIHDAFPRGVRRTSDRNAWSAEIQLPTPVVTLVGKYFRGGDLRFYFQGQFNDVFTDLGGSTSIGSALSVAGRAIPFGRRGGVVFAADLEPVMGQGGFVQLGFPLSRIFQADAAGRNAGWTLYTTYGVDSAFAKDAIRANGLLRTDHASVQLRYKINRWVSFVHEETYLVTRTAGSIRKAFRGLPAHEAHAWRSEAGTIFTF